MLLCQGDSTMNHFCRALLLGLLLAVGGCGSSDDRCAVSGTVTLGGKQLDQGNIMFVPVVAATGSQVSALIKAGNYQIPKEGGLRPGKYRVDISSTDGATPDPVAAPDAAPGPTGNFSSKERIPAKFNLESKLEVEVQKGQANKFDFPIP